MTHSSVTIQIAPISKPSTPSWMGEIATFAQILTPEGILKAIQEQARFALLELISLHNSWELEVQEAIKKPSR